MPKVKLTIQEVAQLNKELNLVQTEKDLSFKVKYELAKLLEKSKEVIKNFEKQRDALLKQYGIEDKNQKGVYTLKDAKEEEKGLEELKKLIEIEETFAFSCKLSDFEDLQTSNSYTTIFKFME